MHGEKRRARSIARNRGSEAQRADIPDGGLAMPACRTITVIALNVLLHHAN